MRTSYEQSSLYINLNGRQELSALCRSCDGEWVRSKIDLNSVLGNCDGIPAFPRSFIVASNRGLGSFEWGGSDFGASARNIELQDGKVLCAHLKRKDGSWTEKAVTVNLTEHITNSDGTLRRSDQEDMAMIAPDVCEKLNAVRGLIRNQQAVIDNGTFQLEYITATNQRIVLQELEVAFLRLSKLAACIKGEFDEEQKDGGVPQSNPDAVLRPIIRSFENVSTKTDKALGLLEKIFEFVSTL